MGCFSELFGIKTDCHDINEILLKVAFNTIKQTYLLWMIGKSFNSELLPLPHIFLKN
jgi:hypothetical protein